jgi:hypothetical protein
MVVLAYAFMVCIMLLAFAVSVVAVTCELFRLLVTQEIDNAKLLE